MKPSFKCQSDLKKWKVFTISEPPAQPAGLPRASALPPHDLTVPWPCVSSCRGI